MSRVPRFRISEDSALPVAALEAWRRDEEEVDGRICLTQSLFACLQTSPRGQPLLDWDANGQPKLHRDRAITLLRAAGALVLSGDQHLGSLIRHGIDSHTDGVVQFTGPAGVSFWQRWFEPRAVMENGGAEPYTGDFTDAFGNKLRVHAIANPRITFAYYRQFKGGRSQALGDQRLKSEGYGLSEFVGRHESMYSSAGLERLIPRCLERVNLKDGRFGLALMIATGETSRRKSNLIVVRRGCESDQASLGAVLRPIVQSCDRRERCVPCEAVDPKPWGHF